LQVKESHVAKATSDTADHMTGPSYRIKPGDSLEKIARANQTTVQAIKELNGLTNDRIVVGKLLQLPEK
jgi:LysM repeat protein